MSSSSSPGENALNLVVGTYTLIWVKTDSKSVLRVLEVLEVNAEDNSFLGWYNIHQGSGQFNPELPLAQRRLIPEWADKKTQQRGKPKPGQEYRYTEIYGEFGASEIEVIMPSFPLQSYGKVPEPVCKKADTWLRKAMLVSPRAVLALSYPTEQERKRQDSFGGRKR